MVTLLGDAEAADRLLDVSDTQFSRRAYYRSIFAATEGIIWLIKQVCLKATPIGGGDRRIEVAEYSLLRDQTYDLKSNGEVVTQAKFLRLPDNFRFTVNVFNKLFQSGIDLEVGQTNWNEFLEALKVRHRITHPKELDAINISDAELELCRRVSGWKNEIFLAMVQSIADYAKLPDNNEA